MKRFFEILGFLSLICFSFFYTEKTVDVVKEVDTIMIELKAQEKNYYVKPENAKEDGDFVVPGISGKIVNRSKSYEEMKHYGKFHPNLLKFDKVVPENSIKGNYDKYIQSGNPKKRQVSLLFVLKEEDHYQDITKILDEEKVKATFFVDGKWMEQNKNKILKLIDADHTIGNYSFDKDYGNSSFIWMDTIIKKVGGQKQSYCFVDKKNTKTLETCRLQKDYTIYPEILVKENPYTEVKKQVANGSIISMEITQQVIKELPMTIQYLKQKGYDIVNLETMLTE